MNEFDAQTVIQTLCERVRTLDSLCKYYQDKINELEEKAHETDK